MSILSAEELQCDEDDFRCNRALWTIQTLQALDLDTREYELGRAKCEPLNPVDAIKSYQYCDSKSKAFACNIVVVLIEDMNIKPNTFYNDCK